MFSYFTSIGKEVPNPIYLENNLSPEESQEKEDYWRHYYEEHGYTMLNKGYTGIGKGSLGNVHKWNKVNVTVEASKYNSKREFQKGSPGAYDYAWKHGLLDDLFDNLRIQWNEELVRKEAIKYKTKDEFQKGCSGAYKYARKYDMLDELFGKSVHWDENSIKSEAAKYNTKAEFKKCSGGAYQYAKRHNMLDELFPKKEKGED